MSIWDDVRNGDLVTVTKGETAMTGRVKGTDFGDFRIAFDDRAIWFNTIEGLSGWSLEILERATILLPTMPGFYEDKEGSVWRVRIDSSLHCLSDGSMSRDSLAIINSHPEDYAPFDRLVLEKESN